MHLAPRVLLALFLFSTSSAGVLSAARAQAPASPDTTLLVTNPAPPDAPAPAQAGPRANDTNGNLSGTVKDANGGIVAGATVALDDADSTVHRTQVTSDSGFFDFADVKAGIPYRITVSSKGFGNWVSPTIMVAAGQFFEVTGIQLRMTNRVESVTVYSSTEQIAVQQVRIEEQQRVLGFIPNFYVVYNAKDAVPMTARLKFQMALKVSVDPISFLGTAFVAGINQAGHTPNYPEGAKGYGERFGANYADGLTDTMFGGAILPSLLHQDPRYFYQGTGTKKSRLQHAMAAAFVCKGDNGRWQPNYSSVGGDLISSAISNAYYPADDRGAGLLFENLLISTGERIVSTIFQEFVVRKFTPSANRQN